MAMKLLAPSEARDKAKKTEEATKYRLVELDSLVLKKNRELADSEANFALALKKQRNVWSAEEQEHENKVVSLRKTVEALEERRRAALVPLTKRAEELDTKASVLDVRKQELDEKEADLDLGKAALVVRLDEVAERELQADKTAKTLTLREEGVKAQATQVAASSVTLTAAIAQAAKEAAERNRELVLREVATKAKEENIAERERKANEKEAGFANREKAIQDERFTLNKAIEETNKQDGTKQNVQRHPIRGNSDTRDSGGSV